MAGRSISDIVEVFLLPAVYYSLKEHVLNLNTISLSILFVMVKNCHKIYNRNHCSVWKLMAKAPTAALDILQHSLF